MSSSSSAIDALRPSGVYRAVTSPSAHGQPALATSSSIVSRTPSPSASPSRSREWSRPIGLGHASHAIRPTAGIHMSSTSRSVSVVSADAIVDSCPLATSGPWRTSSPGSAHRMIVGAATIELLVRMAAAGRLSESVSGTQIE